MSPRPAVGVGGTDADTDGVTPSSFPSGSDAALVVLLLNPPHARCGGKPKEQSP